MSEELVPVVSAPVVRTQEESTWDLYQRQCKAFIASGLLPTHITQGVDFNVAMAKALTIAWKGKELGLPIMQAFSSITVINGKPCLSAELMLALIFNRVPGAQVNFVTPAEKQNEECVIEMTRPGGAPQKFRFGMDDAHRAKLVRPNSPWEKFPAAMLRARAISAGARAVFPDCIMGCYTPEEIGVETNEEGDIKPASKNVEGVKAFIDKKLGQDKTLPTQPLVEKSLKTPSSQGEGVLQ